MKKEILYTIMGMTDDGEFIRLHSLSIGYSGPWMMAKKGREVVEQNMKLDQAQAKQNRANSQQQFDTTNKLEGEEIASTTPGSLSPAATAMLASDRDQIANTYNGIRQTAFRTLGQRGMGSAPSGFAQTAENAADLGEATADTGAYRNAQVQTQNQRQDAEHVAAGMTGTEGSLGNSASGESTTAAVDRSKMGSTAGDVLGAAAQLAPIVAASSLAKGGIGKYAEGGPVPGRTPIIVGERGPELFVPPTAGRIIPNKRFSNIGRTV